MIRLGEPVFKSVQGEGPYTGRLSIWVRFFGCNLTCSGFGEKDPTNPSTWEIPVHKIPSSINEVPIFTKGCDSTYSWDSNYKHLTIDYDSYKELYADIKSHLFNGKDWHNKFGNKIDLCFTGGEPMLRAKNILEIVQDIFNDNWQWMPLTQIETNGTIPLSDDLLHLLPCYNIALNISPKLFNVSGERNAIRYDVLTNYIRAFNKTSLKFVVNSRPECWDELDNVVKTLSSVCDLYNTPVYVMPVGATKESQEDLNEITKIAKMAIDKGYHVSGRLHCHLFGNGIGT